MLNVLITILLAVHVIVSLLLVLIVLMQRPKSEGLGAAFGGGMTDQVFGAQTTSVLQSFTRSLGISFFVLTLVLALLYAQRSRLGKGEYTSKLLSEKAAVTASPTPGVPSASPAASASAIPAASAAPSVAVEAEASPVAAPAAAPSASATP